MTTNPYQSPNQPWGVNPTLNPRPTAITVFGVLNIAFGLMGICGVLFSSLIFVMPSDPNMPNPVLELMAENPVYRTINMVMLALGFIATVVLVVAGIGLLQFKSYGRVLSMGYAVYALVSALLGFIVTTMFVTMPLMERMNALPDGPAKTGAIFGIVGGYVGLVVGLIYPSLLLYFMTRPNVVAALAPAK